MTMMSSVAFAEKPIGLLFQALSNPSRLKIVSFLEGNKKGSSVSEICSTLDLEQTQASHALRCLTFCGLVTPERQGKSIIYSLKRETVLPILASAKRHVATYATNLYQCDALER